MSSQDYVKWDEDFERRLVEFITEKDFLQWDDKYKYKLLSYLNTYNLSEQQIDGILKATKLVMAQRERKLREGIMRELRAEFKENFGRHNKAIGILGKRVDKISSKSDLADERIDTKLSFIGKVAMGVFAAVLTFLGSFFLWFFTKGNQGG